MTLNGTLFTSRANEKVSLLLENLSIRKLFGFPPEDIFQDSFLALPHEKKKQNKKNYFQLRANDKLAKGPGGNLCRFGNFKVIKICWIASFILCFEFKAPFELNILKITKHVKSTSMSNMVK